MTCIVGIKTKDNVYIGGDSLGSDAQGNCDVRKDTKVFRNGEFIAGYTTSFRMGQLLAYVFKAPRQLKKVDPYIYMVKDFVPKLIECFEKGKYLKSGSSGDKLGGTFLIGYKNELYIIYDDFQVGISSNGFDACGCGEYYARGSLYSTKEEQKVTLTPQERIIVALAAAQEFHGGVRAPFNIISLNEKV